MAKAFDFIQEYRQRMTGEIPRSVAQLYSAHIRLAWESQMPPGTLQQDRELLQDAVKLIQAAFFERDHHTEPQYWQASLRRAGEILEWLSHPQMELSAIPTRLLAAAAYQLAGYPARASGLLRSPDAEDSPILQAFLRNDFSTLLKILTSHWTEYPTDKIEYGQADFADPDAFSRHWSDLVISSILSAIGVIAAQMRWGAETRVQRAIDKLRATAKLLLHCDDFYSWLIGELCAQVSNTYITTSLRQATQDLMPTESGKKVLERYLRQAYQQNKTIAWPSQLRGIERLRQRESFALCTPTGSGKTTVAELAILQGLFSNIVNSTVNPLVLYLVPSRALATEVEFKLSAAFKALRTEESPEIIVTGLYGGADWGPTDAWLFRNDPTVLICTYEKAEALMRYLGPMLTERLSLVVLDEAHRIQFDGNEQNLAKAEDRSLRLENLAMRLFPIVEQHKGRIIALSAVAQEMEIALAGWVANAPGTEPVKVDYHSTRQLLGRLECYRRNFKIYYDSLDRKRLHLDDTSQSPFVPRPFPPYPLQQPLATQGSLWGPPKVVKQQKAKIRPKKPLNYYLFWAAIQLAQHQTVLVAVPQHPEEYAQDLLILLELWQQYPDIAQFTTPPGTDEDRNLWSKCLESCADYLGEGSNEYRLLQKRVILHHGKMPAPLARLLLDLIASKTVRLVVATSTLSEGVNLPFETILVPSLQRGNERITEREIGNLMGRAGRPGFATEGRVLVLTAKSKNIDDYNELCSRLERIPDIKENPQSALQKLLVLLYERWKYLTHSEDFTEFLAWLEQISPEEASDRNVDTVDTLDDVLLNTIVEMEDSGLAEIDLNNLEESLKTVWRRSYAYFAHRQEDNWEQVFVRRGRAIVAKEHYGDRQQRRRLYATTLPPSAATHLLDLYPKIEEILKRGADYAAWDKEQRFDYIRDVAAKIGQIPKIAFAKPSQRFFERAEWQDILHWWLDPFWGVRDDGSIRADFVTPSSELTFKWYEYVNTNFTYKLNWGIGACISTAFNRAYDNAKRRVPSVENWPDSGLPWIVFWLKELITWGTLDPVAAYLLARARSDSIVTRPQAQTRAQSYYEEHRHLDTNEQLNPETIQEWAARLSLVTQAAPRTMPPPIRVTLLRDFNNASQSEFRVLPAQKGGKILWFDAAGFLLAESDRPGEWNDNWLKDYDFSLEWRNNLVRIKPYL